MNTQILETMKKIEGTIFFVLDAKYRYIEFSNEHAKIMKMIWNVDIQKGKSILNYILSVEDRKKAKKNIDAVLAGEDFTVDEHYGDTSFFRTLWRINYAGVRDEKNEITAVLVIVNELTEHIKMQNRFNELKIFESVINLIPLGVVITDPNKEDMPIVFANDSFSRLTGYSKEEVVGENCRFLNQYDRDQNSLEIIREAIKNGQSCEVELYNYKKSGKKYFSMLQVFPIFDNEKNIVYYVGIQHDITDKVEKKTNEVLKNIASGLTHEINTALVSLSASLDMISYEVEDLEDAATRDYMDDSIKEVINSQKTINKIVNSLHYLGSSTFKSKEKFDIYETIQTSIDLFKQKIENRKIKLFINDSGYKDFDEVLSVLAEKDSILHLIEILIENSIDAVTEVERTGEIYLNVNIENENLHLQVQDNGCGINEEIRDEIFKPLIKGKSYKGVGIGLTTAKIIVDKHGGNISFDSSPAGTVFDIVLDHAVYLEEEN